MSISVESIKSIKSIEAIEEFNKIIKIITRNVVKKFPNDPTISRIQKRISIITDINPVLVIEKVGQYLYKYRDKIYKLTSNKDAEMFFLDNTYATDFNKANASKSDIETIVYLVTKLKELGRSLPEYEKMQYKQYVIDMLDMYIFYMTDEVLHA